MSATSTMNVSLTEAEWQQVIAVISTAPWRQANPLIMRIAQQLQAQQEGPNPNPIPANGNHVRSSSTGANSGGHGEEHP